MKTFDHGFENGKGKIKRKKGNNSNLKKVQRFVASLSKEQISRMVSDSGKPYLEKGADVTGDSIYKKTKNNSVIQAKLEISQPNDRSEQQADKVAAGVTKGDTNLSKTALEQPVADISTKGESGGMTTTPGFDQQLQGTKGQGQKLNGDVKSEMESHLGTDLSGVNIHTSGNAKSMSEDINAKAFTHGQDVYFNQGQYNPSSVEGKSLLAHELTHTVQQGNGLGRKIQRKEGDLTQDQIKNAKEFNQNLLKKTSSIKTIQYIIGISDNNGKIEDLTPTKIAVYQAKNKITVNGKIDETTLNIIFTSLISGTPPQYENAKDLIIDYYSINTSGAIIIKYDSSLKDAVSTSFAIGTLQKISLGSPAFKDSATLKTSIETGLNTKNTTTTTTTPVFTATGSPTEFSQKEKNIAVKVNNMLLKEPASIKIVATLVSANSKAFDDAFITSIVKYQWRKKQQGDQEVKDKKRTESPTIKETGIIDEDTSLELLNDLLQKDEFDLFLMLVDDYYKLNIKSLGYDPSITESTGYKTGTDPVTKKVSVSIGKSFFTEKDSKKIKTKLEAIKGIGKLESLSDTYKEWQEHPRIQNYFADGLDGYISLKGKLEKLIKVKNPDINAMAYLDEKIKTFKFLGQNLTLHDSFKTVLERIETKLKTNNPTGYEEVASQYKGHVQGFWVRTIAGKGVVSQHSLGMAIDIDPETNPHVKGEDKYKVITYVTGLEIYKKQPSAKELQEASVKFKSDFNATYITALEKKKTNLDTFIKLSAKLTPQATLIKDLTAAVSIYDLTAPGKPQTKERTDLVTKIAGFKTTLDSLTTEFNTVKTDVDTKAQENFQSRLDNAKIQQQNLKKIGDGSTDRKIAYDTVIVNQKTFTVLFNNYLTISVSLAADLAKKNEILKAINKNKASLLSYGKTGFFDISLTLVNSLLAEKEIRWGGNYKTDKDFMHFEIYPMEDFL